MSDSPGPETHAMDSYDISRLTDYDFESVCKDIFESELGIRLEIFAPGADQGVDLRYLAPGAEGSLIIQCKHWERQRRATLLRHMRSVELAKIRRLAPSRYILATSVALSKQSKDTLAAALHPYVQSPGDIYGL